jgi:hypothetical protein
MYCSGKAQGQEAILDSHLFHPLVKKWGEANERRLVSTLCMQQVATITCCFASVFQPLVKKMGRS